MNGQEKLEIVVGALFCVAAVVIFISVIGAKQSGVETDKKCSGGIIIPSMPFTIFHPIGGGDCEK